nr:MAG TPA: Scavenger receptor cysteine-rich domain [Caudoviricetes sp.]
MSRIKLQVCNFNIAIKDCSFCSGCGEENT